MLNYREREWRNSAKDGCGFTQKGSGLTLTLTLTRRVRLNPNPNSDLLDSAVLNYRERERRASAKDANGCVAMSLLVSPDPGLRVSPG